MEYAYEAKEPDELTLVKGTIIHNIKLQPGGWSEGSLPNGRVGMFPDNFVKIIETAGGGGGDDLLSSVVLR